MLQGERKRKMVIDLKSRADSGGDDPLSPLEALQSLDQEFPLIERVPGRCAGQPTLKDTRLRVTDVLNIIAQYADIAPAIEQWGDRYSLESWQEALRYAANYIEETVPLER